MPALVALVVFAGALRGGLVMDDTLVLEWLGSRRWDLRGIFLEPRSLTYAVHALDRAVFGTHAAGLHLTNLLLHALATGLAGLLAWRLTRSRLTAWVTGLAFAVHPVHVEAVVSIANRKDLLATIFVLLAVLAWIGIEGRARRALAVTALYALGLYAKEVAAVALPIVLLLVDALVPGAAARGTKDSPRAGRLDPLVLAGLGLVVAFAVTPNWRELFTDAHWARVSGGHYDTLHASLATAVGNACEWPRLLFFPARLLADYPVRPQPGFFTERALLGAGVVILWVGAAIFLGWKRRAPVAALSLAWVFVLILPCANVIPLHHIHVAERYLYAPSFGACLLFGHVVERVSTAERVRVARWARPALAAAALVLLVTGAVRSALRVTDWRSEEALVAAADRDGLDTWRAHRMAMRVAARRGDLDEAARRATLAALRRPGDPELQLAMASSCLESGELGGALRAGRAAVRLQPMNPAAHYVLGLAHVRADELEAGIEALLAATRLDPDSSKALYNLGVAYGLAGETRAAEDALERCIALSRAEPHSRAHAYLGALRARRGDLEGALEAYERAELFEPENVALLADVARTCAAQGHSAWAIRAFRKLARLTPEDPEPLRRLASLCAEAGDLAGELDAQRRRAELIPDDPRALLALADAQSRDGEPAAALATVERAAELAPLDAEVRAARRRLLMAAPVEASSVIDR